MPFQAHLASSRKSTHSNKSATADVSMSSAEIATTKAEMDAEMDAKNADCMDAKTTGEVTYWKDADIIEIETRVPPTNVGFPPPHHVSPRFRETRTKSAGRFPAKTRRRSSSHHVIGNRPIIPGKIPGQVPT